MPQRPSTPVHPLLLDEDLDSLPYTPPHVAAEMDSLREQLRLAKQRQRVQEAFNEQLVEGVYRDALRVDCSRTVRLLHERMDHIAARAASISTDALNRQAREILWALAGSVMDQAVRRHIDESVARVGFNHELYAPDTAPLSPGTQAASRDMRALFASWGFRR